MVNTSASNLAEIQGGPKSQDYGPIIAGIGDGPHMSEHEQAEGIRTYLDYLSRHYKPETNADPDQRELFLAGIEDDRNKFFEDHLFPLSDDLRVGLDESHNNDQQGIVESFMRARSGKNLGERFALSLSSDYLGKIQLVKLAATTHQCPDESRRLYEEYCDLERWLYEHGLVDGNSSPCGDSLWVIAARLFPSDVPEHHGESVIVAMAYPVAENVVGTVNNEGQRVTADFLILKEVVIELSAREYDAWMQGSSKENGDIPLADKTTRIEELIYGPGQQLPLGLKRHYTAYYSAAVETNTKPPEYV